MYQIDRKKRNTEPSKDDVSLFKYLLSYKHDNKKEKRPGCPDCLYSFDTPSERSLFLSGLTKEQRKMWMSFQDNLPDEEYQFFAWCYPLFISTTDVIICYTATPSNTDRMKSFTSQDAEYISQIAATIGFNISTIRPINQYNTDPKPTLTPKFHPNLEKFNGMNAVKRWLMKTYGPKGLIEVQVYDNLCYNSENHIANWIMQANLAEMVVQNPSKYKAPVSVSAVFSNPDSFKKLQTEWSNIPS